MLLALETLAVGWGPLHWSWATWLIVVGTLGACAGLFAVSRTNWGRKRPTRRYAAASLAAHLLLLGIASTVRYGDASPGDPEAPPVRVTLIARAPSAESEDQAEREAEAPEAAPNPDHAWSGLEQAAGLDQAAGLSESDDSAPKDPEPTSPPTEPRSEPAPPSEPAPSPAPAQETAAPETPPTPKPKPQTTPASETASNPEQAWSGLDQAPGLDHAAALDQAAGLNEAHDSSPQEPESPAPPTEPRNESAPPTAAAQPPIETPIETPPAAPTFAGRAWNSQYATRTERARLRLAEEQGGDQQTENAVARGLDWIARAQRPDGAWDAVRWGAGRERRVLDHDRGGAGARAETGLTGLALLALMGGGHSHLDGPYCRTVEAGLAYLVDAQASDGDLAGHASLYARMYCHSMATFALAEALANSGDDRLRPAVERAIAYLVRAQSSATGGWRYRPGDRGDMSQMGWALMALRSAEIAGVDIRPGVWSGVERFVRSVARGGRGGLASYQPEGPATPTMTAEALYCRQILGVAPGQPAANAEAVAALVTNLPPPGGGSSRPANLYYWYYATLALHHQRGADVGAAAAWVEWNDALKRALLPRQVGSGQNAGSWSPNTLWGGYGGRVYTTALATMCLEVYYRYDPDAIGRDPWIAAREQPLRR